MSNRTKFNISNPRPSFLEPPVQQELRIHPSLQTAWQITHDGTAEITALDVGTTPDGREEKDVVDDPMTGNVAAISDVLETQS